MERGAPVLDGGRDENGARQCQVAQAAGEVDRLAVPVAVAGEHEAAGDASPQRREWRIGGTRGCEQRDGRLEERLRLGRDEHRCVADRLDERDRRAGGPGCDRGQSIGDVAQERRSEALAQRSEADDVDEEDADLTEIGGSAGAHLVGGDRRAAELGAEVLLDRVAGDGAGHRQQLLSRKREPMRKLMLPFAGLQEGLAGDVEHRRSGVRRCDADLAVQPQELVRCEPHRRGLLHVTDFIQIGRAEPRFIVTGNGKTERSAQASDVLGSNPGQGRDLLRRVPLPRRIERAFDSEHDEPPFGGGFANLPERHPAAEEVAEQCGALGSLARIMQTVEQPLSLQVDRHGPSVGGKRRRLTRSGHGLRGGRVRLSSRGMTADDGCRPARRAVLIGLIGPAVVTVVMLWLRRHPSACPYALRLSLQPPHPLITRTRLRKILVPRPGERILEIGPGTGFYTIPMAEWIGPQGRLDVLDVQQAMLDFTMRRADRHGIENIAPACADAGQLPYENATFDAVVIITTLGEIPDQRAAWAEISRVLKPSGRVVNGELFFGDPHWVTPRTAERLAAAAGLARHRRLGPAIGYFARHERR